MVDRAIRPAAQISLAFCRWSLRNPNKDTELTAPQEKPRHIQSITIGVRLLQAIEKSDISLSLKEISESVGMPTGQAHLYLASLKMTGLVVQDPASSRYSLGPFALQLGLSALRNLDVVELAKEYMNEIRDQTGETVYLSVWGNRGATIVLRLDGKRPLPMTVRVGYNLPLIGSATGKIFLSYLPAEITEQHVRDEQEHQKKTREARSKDSQQLLKIRVDVRKKGYAETDNLRQFTGFSGLAAPVFDHESELCAVLTVIGPKGQIDVSANGGTLRVLRRGALELSSRLGYRK
jgi:DNA-binding IclR family transcriptional regulator